mmetsp:Transcript_28414/g.91590  ORF Transcript_28414/g.91590 Transcript_28414/m.91590 type:complete len:277 (-) Transcript_28414:125-955(-)
MRSETSESSDVASPSATPPWPRGGSTGRRVRARRPSSSASTAGSSSTSTSTRAPSKSESTPSSGPSPTRDKSGKTGNNEAPRSTDEAPRSTASWSAVTSTRNCTAGRLWACCSTRWTTTDWRRSSRRPTASTVTSTPGARCTLRPRPRRSCAASDGGASTPARRARPTIIAATGPSSRGASTTWLSTTSPPSSSPRSPRSKRSLATPSTSACPTPSSLRITIRSSPSSRRAKTGLLLPWTNQKKNSERPSPGYRTTRPLSSGTWLLLLVLLLLLLL